jgi:phosphatidate cytidylyltransferase
VATVALRGMSVPGSGVVKRVVTAAVGIPLFVAAMVHAPALLFHALVIAVAGAAAWELARMLQRAGRETYGRLAVAGAMAVAASFTIPGAPVVTLTVVVGAALGAAVVTGAAPSVEPAATSIMTVVYTGWLVGHAILLRDLADGIGLVLFLVGVTWAGETAAYAAGNLVGRHKLAPRLSPGKTIEGAAAQVVVSLALAPALARWLLPGWPVDLALAAGLLLGVVGQVGDLAESAIKRSLKTKDAGGLFPGHGGVLDRVDSLLFSTPALYYAVVLAGVRP